MHIAPIRQSRWQESVSPVLFPMSVFVCFRGLLLPSFRTPLLLIRSLQSIFQMASDDPLFRIPVLMHLDKTIPLSDIYTATPPSVSSLCPCSAYSHFQTYLLVTLAVFQRPHSPFPMTLLGSWSSLQCQFHKFSI
jgi:hypothetical protein